MTAADLIPILPLIILGGGVVITMLAIAVYRSHILTFILTLATLIASVSTLRVQSSAVNKSIGPLIRFDGYAVFFMIIILLAAVTIVVMAYGYLRGRSVVREELYVLVLTAMLGCMFLVSSVHFASFFLGLELLSVSLYSLAAYHRAQAVDIEAGIKYLVPAATSSAFLLFGMALVYAYTGTMSLSVMAETGRIPAGPNYPVAFVGAGMILVGLAFKLALIPFHFWAGDVYEGAPAPVTALIATTSKGAVFSLLLRYFSGMDVRLQEPFFSLLTWLAVFTMLIGTYLALRQNNIKRLLAYSSITHMGYLLIAFLAVEEVAATALSFYLLTYFITTLGAFGVIAALSGKDGDFTEIGDYRGLIADHPFLGGVLTAMMLSLAGVPLTAGFLGKFYLLYAGVRSDLWLLVLVLVAASVISLFYYLRVVVTMYQPTRHESEEATAASARSAAPSGSWVGVIVLVVLLLSLIWIGVYPAPILHFIQEMIA